MKIVLAAVLCFVSPPASGEPIRWISPGGGTWSDGANWADGVVPGFGSPDDLDIAIKLTEAGTVVANGDLDVGTLDFSPAGVRGVLRVDYRMSVLTGVTIGAGGVLGGRGLIMNVSGGSAWLFNDGEIDQRGQLSLLAMDIVNRGTVRAAGYNSASRWINEGVIESLSGTSVEELINTAPGRINLRGFLTMLGDRPVENSGLIRVGDGSHGIIDFAMINRAGGRVEVGEFGQLSLGALRSEGEVTVGPGGVLGATVYAEFNGETRVVPGYLSPISAAAVTLNGPLVLDVDGLVAQSGQWLYAVSSHDMRIDLGDVRVEGRMRRGLNAQPPAIYDGASQQILYVEVVRPCPADITDRELGEYADGEVTGADLSAFVELWLAGDPVADMTVTGENPGSMYYGVADYKVDGADLSYFVSAWLDGLRGGC